MSRQASELVLANRQIAWHLEWSGGPLRSFRFDNRISGLHFDLCRVQELALVFSAATDRIAEPLQRVADFTVRRARQTRADRAVFELQSPALALGVELHVQLDGPTRRKWVEVTNRSKSPLLLLDVEIDDFTTEAVTTAGAAGKPVFIEDEVFAAIEHPSGTNLGGKGRVRMAHFPGRLLAPRVPFRSHTALVSVAAAGQANAHFIGYIQAKSRPRPKLMSAYTPFGINNQFGSSPTLDDEQMLDVLALLRDLKKQGVSFDYFTLDTGWVDPSSDLTRFKPTSFPTGPAQMLKEVRALHLKFGLWFGTSWGLQSCWNYPGAFPDGKPPTQQYREGHPLGLGGLDFCLGEARYFSILKKAVLHHVRHNGVRFLKFDGGSYFCEKTDHGHLPGKYSIEPMHEKLIDLAKSARAANPDVFIMWYWGLSSPFWALHGDAIFESGLMMEGSGTSSTPTLYYRDSVTLAQDQNAYNARTIPPLLKDSLGVWLADTRWGNFMGMERWRETLVMDLGRGSRLFPNLWGNLYNLTPDDVKFLRWIGTLAKKNAGFFQNRRLVGGDPFRNELYGYAHGRGSRAFLFLNNAHFESRSISLRLDASLGLDGRRGTAVKVVSHFPDRERLARPGGGSFRLGDVLELWLRPFETLMVEIAPAPSAGSGPVRPVGSREAPAYGSRLALTPVTPDERMDARFVDAEAFAKKDLVKKVYTFEGRLPSFVPHGGTSAGASAGVPRVLALTIRLRKGAAEWKYAPTVVQIVQAFARVGEQPIQLIPMPDGRQHGNTQSYGCSWLTYKVRLGPQWSGEPLKVAVLANLPADVEAVVEGWIVKRWWKEYTRPAPDGYYTYAPS